jgi:hypothetical protein
MRKLLAFTAVTLMTALVVAGFWAGFLGQEGMKVFWTCMLCSGTLALAFRNSISSNPWAITGGLIVAGFLLGIPAKLMPASNPQYGILSQSGGLSMTEASRMMNVGLYGTIFIFLALTLTEWASQKKKLDNALPTQA